MNGDPETALALLGNAVDLGFRTATLLDENDDFAALRTRPGWGELVSRAQTAAAATRSREPQPRAAGPGPGLATADGVGLERRDHSE